MKAKFYSQGSALILALLVMALTAGLSTLILVQTKTLLGQTSSLINYQQSYWNMQGVTEWACQQLNSKIASVNHIRYLDDKGQTIEGELNDLQRLFNLNNLKTDLYQADFRRLLQNVDHKLSENQAKAVTEELVELLTPQRQAEIDKAGAEESLLVDKFELLKAKDMTPELFQALAAFITVLPKQPTRVNVNTASKTVLQSLASSLTSDVADAIIEMRQQAPFTSNEDFLQRTSLRMQGTDLSNIAAKITVASEYYQALAHQQASSYCQESLIHYQGSQKRARLLKQIFLPQGDCSHV